jgi:Ribbon-helix-helix protein, copG family
MARLRDWQQHYWRSKKLWHYQIVRLDHEDAEALRELAKRRRTTVAELIRTFITWGLENDYGGADAD